MSYARQNLPLIVDHGRPNPELGNSAVWGATIGDAVLVWRSGIGIDRHGNLIYAAGNDQTVASLAAALIRAGAVRAMELDINPYWVSFITYGGFGALGPVEPASRHEPRGDAVPDTRRPGLFRSVCSSVVVSVSEAVRAARLTRSEVSGRVPPPPDRPGRW